MAFTRLEEYVCFENGLPFVLHTNLQKTQTNYSKMANWHENLEIQLCLQGEGYVLLNGEKYPFHKENVIVANSGVLHNTTTDGYLEYACLIIDTTFCQKMGVDYQHLYFTPRVENEEIRSLFHTLIVAYTQENEYKMVQLNALVLQILAQLCTHHAQRKQKETPPHDNEIVKRVLRYIREHYHEKLSLDFLAKIALCDKYTLTRIFKKVTSQTVTTYINRLRCDMAANMLANGASVTQSALSCGFENFSYFAKTFALYMGELPSKYKTCHQNKGAGMR